MKLPVFPCPHVWPLSSQKKVFLAKNNTALVRQPPYSPDLAPSDFWIFFKLKTALKRTRFQSPKNIMVKTKAALRSIPEEEFKRCFQEWQTLGKVCALAREYFKENYIKFVLFLVLCVLCPKVRYCFDRPRISYEAYMPIIRWCCSNSSSSDNKSYSVFIRCCPLIRDGRIHPISSAIACTPSLH